MENMDWGLGAELQEQLSLGLQPGQDAIDLRDEVEKRPGLREDGFVYNRKTGEILNEYPLDDEYIKAELDYRKLMADDPDYMLLRDVAGMINIRPETLVRRDSEARYKQVSEAIREVLRENLKRRSVGIYQRRDLLEGLTKQQDELGKLRDYVQHSYESMAPTVKRWWFLATITGYPYTPKESPDEEFKLLGEIDDPIPYWLLVRYIRPQYEMLEDEKKKLPTEDKTRNDSLYWEPYLKQFGWAQRLLQTYDKEILAAKLLEDEARRVAMHVYLYLRDVVLSSCLRLVPPLPLVDMGEVGNDDNNMDVEERPEDMKISKWFQALPDTSPKGRYHSLRYYLGRAQKAINDNVKPASIRLNAITRSEAFEAGNGNDPSPFAMTKSKLDQETLAAPIEKKDKNIPGMQTFSSFAQVLRLHADVDNDYTITLLKTGTIGQAFTAWSRQLQHMSDVLGGLGLEGYSYWIQFLFESLAAGIGGFLLENAPIAASEGKKMFADDPAAAQPEFRWTQNKGTLLVVDDKMRSTLMSLLLAETKPQYLFRRRPTKVFTRANIDPIHKDRLRIECEGSDGTLLEITILGVNPAEWQLFLTRTESLITLMHAPMHTDKFKMKEAAVFYAGSLLLWSKLLQNPWFVQGFLESFRSVLYSPLAEGLLPEVKKGVANGNVNTVPLLIELNAYKDLAAHFFREVLRSTFQSPYDRSKIDNDVRVLLDGDGLKIGDIRSNVLFTRDQSKNKTVFTTTWEKLYADYFLHPLNGPASYWRANFLTIAENAPEPEGTASSFSRLWDTIQAVPGLDGSTDIPEYALLRFAFPPVIQEANAQGQQPQQSLYLATQETSAQQSLYQSLAFHLRQQWNEHIVPPRMHQAFVLSDDDESEEVAPMDLFHHFIIYTLAYYPYTHKRLLARQREIDKSISDANEYLRAVAANDPNYAYIEVKNIMRNLYVPERDWHMQAMLTGRLEIDPFITSALGLAYNELQDLARIPDNDRNGNNKRWRTPSLDYSHLLDVPLDVISAYTGPKNDPKGEWKRNPTRDYIDEAASGGPSIVAQLRISIALLIVAYICDRRVDVPEAYKTTMQQLRVPMTIGTALRGMLPFRFEHLNYPQRPGSWRVSRR